MDINAKLAEMAESVLAFAEQAGEYVVKETPVFIQEILNWYMWSSGFWVVVGIGVLLLGWRIRHYLINKIYVEPEGRDTYYEEERTVSFVVTWVISLLIAVPTILSNTLDMIQIYVAPRLFLLEHVSKLLNGGGCG